MNIREKVTGLMEREVADVFMLDREYIAANHGLKFRQDLVATSIHYFPIVTALEEDLKIDIDFHEFQYESETIEHAIDFVVMLYNQQNK